MDGHSEALCSWMMSRQRGQEVGMNVAMPTLAKQVIATKAVSRTSDIVFMDRIPHIRAGGYCGE